MCFLFFTHSLAKRNKLVSKCADDSTGRISTELVQNKQSCKRGTNENNTRKVYIRKPPYHCIIPAQAFHDSVPAQEHLSVKAAPVTNKRNEAPGNQCTPLGGCHICFHLCDYVAGSGSAWHITNST